MKATELIYHTDQESPCSMGCLSPISTPLSLLSHRDSLLLSAAERRGLRDVSGGWSGSLLVGAEKKWGEDRESSPTMRQAVLLGKQEENRVHANLSPYTSERSQLLLLPSASVCINLIPGPFAH
ncbi:uncharacterized protein V6R79_018918 [Siganus canaliculatus]